MATTQELLERMRPGQALSKKTDAAIIVCRRSPSGTGYHVLAAYLVPAQHNEDPESVSCGCPFQGKSHAHAEIDQATLDTAEAAYTECKAKFAALHTVTFAAPHRIGA